MSKCLGSTIFAALTILPLLNACSGPSGHEDPPLSLAQHVDLDRYYGRWYIIANIPYYFEKGIVEPYVEDFRRSDGDIEEDYYGRDGGFSAPLKCQFKGHGYVLSGSGNAHWRMTNLWPIYLSELILYVSPDYTYALIGYPDRTLGWVFSRRPDMDDETYQGIMKRFAAMGYDISQFKRIAQTSAQLGRAGFQ